MTDSSSAVPEDGTVVSFIRDPKGITTLALVLVTFFYVVGIIAENLYLASFHVAAITPPRAAAIATGLAVSFIWLGLSLVYFVMWTGVHRLLSGLKAGGMWVGVLVPVIVLLAVAELLHLGSHAYNQHNGSVFDDSSYLQALALAAFGCLATRLAYLSFHHWQTGAHMKTVLRDALLALSCFIAFLAVYATTYAILVPTEFGGMSPSTVRLFLKDLDSLPRGVPMVASQPGKPPSHTTGVMTIVAETDDSLLLDSRLNAGHQAVPYIVTMKRDNVVGVIAPPLVSNPSILANWNDDASWQ